MDLLIDLNCQPCCEECFDRKVWKFPSLLKVKKKEEKKLDPTIQELTSKLRQSGLMKAELPLAILKQKGKENQSVPTPLDFTHNGSIPRGQVCVSCRLPILNSKAILLPEEPCKTYHSHCFKCTACALTIENGEYIEGSGEKFFHSKVRGKLAHRFEPQPIS